jgi:hypothetical protein
MERNLSPSQTRTKNLNTAIKTPPQKIYTKMHHFQGIGTFYSFEISLSIKELHCFF